MPLLAFVVAVTGLAAPQSRWLPPPRPLPSQLRVQASVLPQLASDPHLLYLNFDGVTLHGSPDCSDAPGRCTFLVAEPTATIPPFHGSDAQ